MESGPSVSGKSSFCISLFHIIKSLCTVHKFDGFVIWCSSKRSAVPSRLLAGTKYFRFDEGSLANLNNSKNKTCLIILDDLLNEPIQRTYVTYLRKAAITGMSVSF